MQINLRPFKDFFNSGSAGGIILLLCVITSLALANSPLATEFNALLQTELGWENQDIHLRYPLLLWINDGLMAIFFLLVGLEIKRELVEGELSSFKKASLPVMAAIGGVLLPALIYFFFNHGKETSDGWAIPMATDIAFALAIVKVLGKKVPLGLRIFLAALAIVDDLMAILVIAIFYSTSLHLTYLLYAFGLLILLLLFNRMGVKKIYAYLLPGLFMWYFIHHSGIHATIAGVLVAFTLPTTPGSAKESPLEKLEHFLTKPVNFLIMPLFALANTNIEFMDGMIEGLSSPLGLGIILGLVVGKPVGIFIFSWISIKSGLSQRPTGSDWKTLFGVAMLAGIGFTMSIFISFLSFTDEFLLSESKFAILIASIISAVAGSLALFLIYKSRKARQSRLKKKLRE